MSERQYLMLTLPADERDWVNHAAKLRSMTPRTYIKAAINAQLRKEGELYT